MAKERGTQKEPTELSWVTRLHRASEHHVLILEASLSENDKRKIFHLSKKVRLYRNGLLHEMNKRLEQLFRTKKYRKLSKQLDIARGKLRNAPEYTRLALQKKEIIDQMAAMQAEYRLTWKDCREEGQRLTAKFDIPSVFALTKAEDLWKYISKQLVRGVKSEAGVKFRSRFDWVTLRAKQINRGITVALRDGRVWFGVDGLAFTYRGCSGYVEREMAMVQRYLADAERIDEAALAAFKETGVPVDTFRPCFVTIVPKEIRGRLRVFLHLTIEGGFLEKKRERSLEDIVGLRKILAEDKEHFKKMRGRLLRQMANAKKTGAAKEAVAERLQELNSRYRDNKRYLRDIAKSEEILARQLAAATGV